MRPVGTIAVSTVHRGCTRTVPPRRSGAAGFSLIELMIAITIIGVLIAVGMPSLSSRVERARVASMADFYLDGLRLARDGALQKSAASRFRLTINPNGQYNWRVDWCFPTSVQPCDAAGSWSSSTAPAAGDTNVANPSLSIRRQADSLPATSLVTMTVTPGGATAIYYNSQGWVNTAVQPFVQQLRIDADASYNRDPLVPNVRPTAITINLSGMPERCDPLALAGDSRACSP
jgi:type IV fimbrial biogenesis protein FimT